MRFAFILFTFFLSHVGAAEAQRIIRFSLLQPDEAIQIRYFSHGCYNTDFYELEFTARPKPKVHISLLDSEWAGTKGWIEVGRDTLGNFLLSTNDFIELDKLLDIYRSKHAGHCTTVDVITVSLRSSLGGIAIEKFCDDSGATFFLSPSAITIQRLVSRFTPPVFLISKSVLIDPDLFFHGYFLALLLSLLTILGVGKAYRAVANGTLPGWKPRS